MWISYSNSEVNVFHPVCEEALNEALVSIGKEHDYKVIHHQRTGSLEMDFVVRNIKTGKYLCVVEVKRTPSDVHSARYQYQAMSYVQMNDPNNERPFYILTNLECAFAFRYSSSQPRVVQQMLQPGLIQIGKFRDNNEAGFRKALAAEFADLLSSFMQDRYSYSVTLEQFENHMRKISNNNKQWKSSLAVLLYEYIRGVFVSVGRESEIPYDVHHFRKNVLRICAEAARVNFKEIFSCPPNEYERTASIANDILSHIFDYGRQTVSGDAIAELLHEIASEGMAHQGEVPTDPELARILAVLAKNIGGNIDDGKYLCDPAAGSGNLISSAIRVFNTTPNQVKANDKNPKLIELLSLRLGLNFPQSISSANSSLISSQDIVDLDKLYFHNISVIVLNPPFMAGINCVDRKGGLYRKVQLLKGEKAVTNIGQMNYEGAFLETICAFCEKGTTIACILPKTHLTARGREALALRKFLLTEFGLRIIFSYPETGLFENVTKGTCIVVGKVAVPTGVVKILSSSEEVSDIDLNKLESSLNADLQTGKFSSLTQGIEGVIQNTSNMNDSISEGWRQVYREYADAILFLQNYIISNPILTRLSDVPMSEIKRKRGSAGNKGASNLIFLDRNSYFYEEYNRYATIPAMRNARQSSIDIVDGDSAFLRINDFSEKETEKITSEYSALPQQESSQQRAKKTPAQLSSILKSEARNICPANSVLIPRGIRSLGRVYMTSVPTIVSTNFIVFEMRSSERAAILASWTSTIFYQIICEINGKQQEGMRKMEVADIEATFIPDFECLTKEDIASLISEIHHVDFLSLNAPVVRRIDSIWAKILFGSDAETLLQDARRLLDFLANLRNPVSAVVTGTAPVIY
jgi:hypothetical protein